MRTHVRREYGPYGMRTVYTTLYPARFQIREGVYGGWYVYDTNPSVSSQIIYNRQNNLWKKYKGAYDRACKLNTENNSWNECSTDAPKTAVASQT